MASSTSAASARTSTRPRPAPSSSARTPRRNIAWSSTITTLTGSLMALLLCSSVLVPGQVQTHLGPLARRGPDLGRASVALHPVDDAVADAVPVVRHGRQVEPATAV